MREVYGDCAAYIDLCTNPGDVSAVTPPAAAPAALLEKYSIRRPRGCGVLTEEEAATAAERLGYPVLLRPS